MQRCALGKKYKDAITGFEGVATQRTEYFEGCYRIGLQGPVDKDGKVPDVEYFDEPRLIVQPDALPGGPRPDPPRAPMEKR
jgi:hypothetical protein